MKSQRVRGSDVAREAGVSISAVSRAFTPGASVSPETRERVLGAAEALGYRPNAAARSLITRRTQLVAVVMANLVSPFFADFLEGLEASLASMGFTMLLILIAGSDEVDDAVGKARDYGVDGAIFVSCAPSRAAAAQLTGQGVTVVLIDRRQAGRSISRVWIDAAAVGAQVAEAFLNEGRRRPAALSWARSGRPPPEIDAFIARLADAGVYDVPVVAAGWRYEDGASAARRLLTGPAARDAVFTTTDMLAIGLYDAARLELGLEVPRALSIIGVGDTPQAGWASHRISTVRLPIAALAQAAVETLAARIVDPSLRAARVAIACGLVRRDTTLPLPETVASASAGSATTS